MFKVLSTLLCSSAVAQSASEPNPPTWDYRVNIFRPDGNMTDYQKTIADIHAEQGGIGKDADVPGQWSFQRFALLFAPGEYDLKVEVGFYTQVAGMGRLPVQVKISDVGTVDGAGVINPGSLQTFWRSIENLYSKPASGSMTWAVSQASPIRRIVIDGDLNLSVPGKYSSGGFMADSYINGVTHVGSQQQYFFRNNHWNSWEYSTAMNLVFLGNDNQPGDRCSNSWGEHHTVSPFTPVIAEKPYIAVDDVDSTKFNLIVPSVEYNLASFSYHNREEIIPFEKVFVANESTTVEEINAKLEAGNHLILQPGQYNLTSSIIVGNENTVVLGIGFATLITLTNKPCIVVNNVDGVRIAGILFQAGDQNATSLVQWGTNVDVPFVGNSSNPSIHFDLFARVGGDNDPRTTNMTAQAMVEINSGNVIIDNAWLWRADHDIKGLTYFGENYVENGLKVYGTNVTTYGVAAEHSFGDQVLWNGEYGEAWFFQSELPYSVTQEDYADKGTTGYRVGPDVKFHKAFGVGAYTYFRDHSPVTVHSSFVIPDTPGVQFTNAFSFFLYCGPDPGSCGVSISNVINDIGGAITNGDRSKYVCSYADGRYTLGSSNESSFLQ